jgi:quinol monooxygenase YgiN
MSELAVWATITVLPGQEAAAERVFEQSREILDAEPGTTSFFAVRIDETTYGVFDTFVDQAALDAHIAGGSGQDAIGALVGTVFAGPPQITNAVVVARNPPA